MQTREVAREFATPLTRLVFQDQNQGLRNSIVQGVTELTAAHGRVVVVEDDLIVGDQFLTFMNAALDRYADNNAVFQVSGHQFPVTMGAVDTPLFLPFTTTWGWATWKRAWQHFDASAAGYRQLLDDRLLRKRFDFDGGYPYFRMLQKQQAGEVDSWGILWYLSVFVNNGLVLFPPKTLVVNEGFDGSGTHSNIQYEKNTNIDDSVIDGLKFPSDIIVDDIAFRKIKKYLTKKSSMRAKIFGWVKEKTYQISL